MKKGDKGLTGDKGATGDSIEFHWDGTKLGIKIEGEPTYQYIDLKGEQGIQGFQGIPGKSMEFLWNGTQLGVKLEGGADYSYVNLKGDKGDVGEQGIQGEAGAPGTHLNLKVSRQYDTYEDLPTNPDIGYMCLVGSDLYIFADNGWVNAGKG